MAKTLTFGIMHLGIAFSVTYALTGSLAVSGAVTFIEPAINTVAHYFFDRYWDKRERRQAGSTRDPASAPANTSDSAALVSA
ncbi:DUF2061 domain-containing protein [Cupriavidus necator]|uniref:DUF2061 domain-containing protein n=1 Tax=Cupriavidus necator TaxID=106590 RepID=UPI00148F67BF|nr:DUF2061 domain-containing protein [Cupriavidus necator]NOV25860.1 DUF2061 domain-containing protein [Cupriavidus necator]